MYATTTATTNPCSLSISQVSDPRPLCPSMRSRTTTSSTVLAASVPYKSTQAPATTYAHLPTELLLEVLDYIPHDSTSQPTLWAFCLVNHQWYNTAIRRLYERPHLYGKNYDFFVRTICPSVNLHVKKSDLAGLVRVLDLRSIVHQSSKSMTARLLGRTKSSLEAFVAPQASFAVNCFAALSKCGNLQTLDLSLISEAISISALANALQRLPRLKVLYFPRSSNDSNTAKGPTSWPHLEELHLSGPLERAFFEQLAGDAPGETSLPPTLTNLSIEHCARVPLVSVRKLLEGVGPQLQRLRLVSNRCMDERQMNIVLSFCPNLKSLEISHDYVTSRFGDISRWSLASHPLERLDLLRFSTDHASDFASGELRPEHLTEALDNNYFPNLRIVRVSKEAEWHSEKVDEVQELQEALELNYMTNHDTESLDKAVGVWTIND
ncbi:hypothetical protein IWZ03DRAFT_348914 [Phyllosticta citriasiana]|uniref:F-box domain-containing protein n=1 Tax=Phyllosticta citriasiana TaxID=595635 RepID=A0ABR1KNR8_9PEZI